MKPLRILALIIGSLLSLAGVALLTGAIALGAVLATQRDGDGYFTTPTETLTTESYAITSDDVDLTTEPGPARWWADRDLATVRVSADGAGASDVFVGIAPETSVETYLSQVPHAEVIDVDVDPFSVEYRQENLDGTATPAPPSDQVFWVATATGPGTQTLTWDLEPGRWAVVVMNVDASAGVTADVSVGGQIDYLPQIALILGALAVVLLAVGVTLIVVGAHGHGSPTAPTTGFSHAEVSHTPVIVEARLDPQVSRWQWLVKWFLAIPHLIVLAFLWVAFVAVTLVALVSILFTGRYPRPMFDFNVGVLRWTWRVNAYALGLLNTDRYPPFSLADDDTYPATLHVEYPETLSRGLVLVKSWLLAVPHLAIIALLASAGGFAGDDGPWSVLLAGGVVGVLALIAGGALLFTGRYPHGIFDFLVGIHRWVFRTIAYVALMTDTYPPFRLDQGGTEPGPRQLPSPSPEASPHDPEFERSLR